MALNITRRQIDEMRECLKLYKPYADNDPVLHTYDAECDENRMKATKARRILEDLGLDLFDTSDYGNITD